MRTRTLMTSPPGRSVTATGSLDELYAPGPRLPQEPRPPSRYRRVIVWTVALIAVALVALVAFKLLTAGQFQDPALSPLQEPAATATATEQPSA